MTNPTIPKQKRAVEKRDHIIQEALEVYQDVGRDYFSMNLVHKRVGGAIGSIYRYFPDRVALMETIWSYAKENGIPLPGDVPVVVHEAPGAAPEDTRAADTVEAFKKWANMVIEKGEGKGDLKAAGEFILREIDKRGL